MPQIAFRLACLLLLLLLGIGQVSLYRSIRKDRSYDCIDLEIQFFFTCTGLTTVLGILFVIITPIQG